MGADVAIGMLISWVLAKVRRAAHRADGVIDQALDAGVEKTGQLLLSKIGGDPAVARMDQEAATDGSVSDETRAELERALVQVLAQDAAFAEKLAAVVGAAQQPTDAPSPGDATAPGGVVIAGDVHNSSENGTAIGVVGRIDNFTVGGRQDPPRSDRA